jgi:Domain of unknown function (DUF1707)
MDTEPGPGENRLAAGAGAAVIRTPDGDREAAAARLNQAAGDGRLTLQEFSERLDRAYAARTRAAYQLPSPTASEPVAERDRLIKVSHTRSRRSARAPARCRSRQGPCISGNSARMSLRGIAGLLPGVRQARAEGRAVPHMALTCECVGGTHRGRGDDDREYARAGDSPKKAPTTSIRGSAWPARSRCAWNSGPTRTPRCWVLRPEYSQVMIRLRP